MAARARVFGQLVDRFIRPRNEKVRANQMVGPDNRPPRECAALVDFAVVLVRGDTNNIGARE